MEISTAVTALNALAQETRLGVYRALVQAGPEGLLAGELAQLLHVPAATLSFHLKTLHHADLVSVTANGRQMRYRARFAEMEALLNFLTDNCCNGRPEACLSLPVTDCAPLACTTLDCTSPNCSPET